MMRRFRLRNYLALALVGLLACVGCSDLPTQPSATDSVEFGSSTSAGQTTSGETTTDAQDPSAATAIYSASTTRTVTLLGGTVRAGNFTVIIPPGALLTTATVTVTQPDPLRPVVNLSITPASANRFLLPVLLVADARNKMSTSLLSVGYISYYNPKTAQWERVPNCTVSLLNMSVTAPLWHFSTYRVESGGKAGW